MDVDDIIAHAAYDPVARRQRYLRNRQLKGRVPAVSATPGPKIGVGSRTIGEGPQSGLHFFKSSAQAAQAASAARQIAAIRGRLDKLKAHLAELLAQKKAASTSSTTKKSSTPSSATKPASPSKPKTAKQKEAAKQSLKKAQQARAQQQKAAPNAKPPATSLTLDQQITQTRAVIADVETKLRTVIAQTRTQTASNGR